MGILATTMRLEKIKMKNSIGGAFTDVREHDAPKRRSADNFGRNQQRPVN
jgi:hypothetical protein